MSYSRTTHIIFRQHRDFYALDGGTSDGSCGTNSAANGLRVDFSTLLGPTCSDERTSHNSVELLCDLKFFVNNFFFLDN